MVKPNAGFKAALRAFQVELGLPPPEPLSPAELHSDAQEFADAEMAARIARTGQPLWAGYDAYMGKIEGALSRGVTDWESVAAGGDIPEGIPEPARLAEDGDAELRHTTSFRLPDETIDAYEARLGQMAAAAGHGVPDRPTGGRPTDSAELLAALFGLLLLRAHAAGSRPWACGLFYAAALLSKESAVGFAPAAAPFAGGGTPVERALAPFPCCIVRKSAIDRGL